MTPQTRLPVHRSALKRRYATRACCLALVLIFSGCASLQLSQFRKRAARGDHEWIAAQAIACKKASEGCAQLHLIKGDACFRLAKMGREPAVNFACAADELVEGLALKGSWNDAGVQLQFQQNLCESLSRLRELQSGEAAEQTLVRFFEAAQTLYQLVPESVSAVYYLSRARLMQMEPMLEDINAATRVPVCIRLKRTVTRVLALMETARGHTLPDWNRFADDYERLAFDLGVAIRTAECR
ncbi:hypothetical protein [uncultured Desulfosarcina sp.]|uniref:hypothetical protein n=1 Tax=uncultured Desulfosarcina sp. TaxID=218289 RepID=UPI0029C7CDD1|nr:hypothetical protein [uncultured Desulfosarcina sp.]